MTTTALRPSWLFDGDLLQAGPTILLDGPTITSVAYDVPAPPDAVVVDLPGATALPGLVDTHVHLAFDASMDPVAALSTKTDEQIVAAMTEAAMTALRGGVTTVRDLGDPHYLSLRLRGVDGLPAILSAGPPITTRDGHCHFLGGAAAPGVDGVRAAVRERAERGVDVVKIMASGGHMTPGSREDLPQFSREELRAAVEEAHAHGLPITAHAHASAAVRDAFDAGCDGIEHATFWSADGVDDPPADLLRAMAQRQVVIGMTGGIVPMPGMPPPPEILRRLPRVFANVAMMRRAGLRLVVGTDAGIAPPKPPDVLRYALVWLHDVGFGPAEALRTVTAAAADVIGVGDRKGRVAPGYDADLLVVDGDPLTDPAALHRVRAVYARGKPVPGVTAPPLTSPASGPLPASLA